MYFGVLRSIGVRFEGIADMGLVESLASKGGFPCRIIWPRMQSRDVELQKASSSSENVSCKDDPPISQDELCYSNR